MPEHCVRCVGTTFHAAAHVTTLAVVVFGDGNPEVLVDRAQADASVAEWGAVTCISCGMEQDDEYEANRMASRVVENASTPWRVINNYTSF